MRKERPGIGKGRAGTVVLAGALVVALAAPGYAQTGAARSDTVPPPSTDPRNVTPPAPGSSGSSTSEQTGSISDQLSRSGGVIHPPANVDPEMRQPAPNTGPNSMPVVPPPGTPENNPQVKPK
jgi:hypothetical protein